MSFIKLSDEAFEIADSIGIACVHRDVDGRYYVIFDGTMYLDDVVRLAEQLKKDEPFTAEEVKRATYYAKGLAAAIKRSMVISDIDEWSQIDDDLDINVFNEGSELKAALYRVRDGKTDTSRWHSLEV